MTNSPLTTWGEISFKGTGWVKLFSCYFECLIAIIMAHRVAPEVSRPYRWSGPHVPLLSSAFKPSAVYWGGFIDALNNLELSIHTYRPIQLLPSDLSSLVLENDA